MYYGDLKNSIVLRLTDEEYYFLIETAAKCGMRPSAFLRRVIDTARYDHLAEENNEDEHVKTVISDQLQ